MIDISKLRSGDVVTVRMKLLSVRPEWSVARFSTDAAEVVVPSCAIVSVEPRVVRVVRAGEAAVWQETFTGKVIAIDGPIAWFRCWGEGEPPSDRFLPLADLVPVV